MKVLKKILTGIGAVVVVLVLISAVSGGSGGKKSSSSSTEGKATAAQAEDKAKDEEPAKADEESSKAEETEPEPEEEAEEVDYSNMTIGQTAELDDGLSLTLNSAQPFMGKYNDDPVVCINVTYVNNGDRKVSFGTYDWKAVDADGVEKTSTFVMDGENELNMGDLQPGGTVTGNIYFEGAPVKIHYYSNMFNDDASVGWVIG